MVKFFEKIFKKIASFLKEHYLLSIILLPIACFLLPSLISVALAGVASVVCGIVGITVPTALTIETLFATDVLIGLGIASGIGVVVGAGNALYQGISNSKNSNNKDTNKKNRNNKPDVKKIKPKSKNKYRKIYKNNNISGFKVNNKKFNNSQIDKNYSQDYHKVIKKNKNYYKQNQKKQLGRIGRYKTSDYYKSNQQTRYR